ncbi:MAG TPA: YdcH family protein [Acetobacteraceae bacterium]|nr:YdcH family protein [Acetobacteraceae bacterium]
MSIEARLRSLEDRHAMLKRQIADEETRPLPDTDEVHRLKVEKLRLKDEMERLRLERAH